jgi:hypothetical protein
MERQEPGIPKTCTYSEPYMAGDFFLTHGYHVEPLKLYADLPQRGTSDSPIQRADNKVRKLRDAWQ